MIKETLIYFIQKAKQDFTRNNGRKPETIIMTTELYCELKLYTGEAVTSFYPCETIFGLEIELVYSDKKWCMCGIKRKIN